VLEAERGRRTLEEEGKRRSRWSASERQLGSGRNETQRRDQADEEDGKKHHPSASTLLRRALRVRGCRAPAPHGCRRCFTGGVRGEKLEDRVSERGCSWHARLGARQGCHRNSGDGEPYPRVSLSVTCHKALSRTRPHLILCHRRGRRALPGANLIRSRVAGVGELSGPFAGDNYPLADRFDNLLVHFIDAQVAFDEDHPVPLTLGDLAVFLPHTAEECILFLLEATFI